MYSTTFDRINRQENDDDEEEEDEEEVKRVRVKVCSQCEDCEYNNVCPCNDDDCCNKVPLGKRDDGELITKGEEDDEDEKEDEYLLKKIVNNLKKDLIGRSEDILNEEITRIISFIKESNNYDLVEIKDGSVINFNAIRETPIFQEGISFSSLENGLYARFVLLKNTFIDFEELKEKINDIFDQISIIELKNKFKVESYYVFYLKLSE